MENLSSVFQKQKTKQNKKKTHEEIEFHNSIEDWVFTTVYRFRKVLGGMPELLLVYPISEVARPS